MTEISYARGPDVELLDRTIGQQLAHTAARWPDHPAIISCHQGKRLTWAQLLNAADGVAHGLFRLGIRPADRVGIWAMNCYEWLVVHMACARAGAILRPRRRNLG
jgi:fatty-acyl-CoA synthase